MDLRNKGRNRGRASRRLPGGGSRGLCCRFRPPMHSSGPQGDGPAPLRGAPAGALAWLGPRGERGSSAPAAPGRHRGKRLPPACGASPRLAGALAALPHSRREPWPKGCALLLADPEHLVCSPDRQWGSRPRVPQGDFWGDWCTVPGFLSPRGSSSAVGANIRSSHTGSGQKREERSSLYRQDWDLKRTQLERIPPASRLERHVTTPSAVRTPRGLSPSRRPLPPVGLPASVEICHPLLCTRLLGLGICTRKSRVASLDVPTLPGGVCTKRVCVFVVKTRPLTKDGEPGTAAGVNVAPANETGAKGGCVDGNWQTVSTPSLQQKFLRVGGGTEAPPQPPGGADRSAAPQLREGRSLNIYEPTGTRSISRPRGQAGRCALGGSQLQVSSDAGTEDLGENRGALARARGPPGDLMQQNPELSRPPGFEQGGPSTDMGSRRRQPGHGGVALRIPRLLTGPCAGCRWRHVLGCGDKVHRPLSDGDEGGTSPSPAGRSPGGPVTLRVPADPGPGPPRARDRLLLLRKRGLPSGPHPRTLSRESSEGPPPKRALACRLLALRRGRVPVQAWP
ncbi:hypothetical protein CB1_000849008 [Camelus ferus]|nr:hypothetical protein CB1_000849008 [Camelus ferus]